MSIHQKTISIIGIYTCNSRLSNYRKQNLSELRVQRDKGPYTKNQLYFYILATKNCKLNLKNYLQLHQKHENIMSTVNQICENVITEN